MPPRRARRAVAAGQRRAVDLQPRAGAALGGDRARRSISGAQRSGWPISVPKPARAHLGRRREEPSTSPPNSGASSSTQRAPARPLGDRVELARRRGSGDVVVGQLGAGAHLERHAARRERRLHLAHARGKLVEDAHRQQVADVRRDGHERRAVGDGEPRELDRVVEVGRAVVDPGQQVEVELGARQPLYRDTCPRPRFTPG